MATKSDKIWADAIRKHVHEYEITKDAEGKVKKLRYLNVLAVQLVRSALDGDTTAMKEVGDRLDGKPGQAIEHSGAIEVRKIIEEFVLPNGTEDTDAADLPTTH